MRKLYKEIRVTHEVSVQQEEELYKVHGYVLDGDRPCEDVYVQVWEKPLLGEVLRIRESRTVPPDGYYEVSFEIDMDKDLQPLSTNHEFSIKIPDAKTRLIYCLTDEDRLDDKCPKCGADLVLRKGRRTGGKFISCSMFPFDRYAIPYLEKDENPRHRSE